MEKKVCVIGLDGGTWTVFKPLLKFLPNLERLVAEGVSGTLNSVIPPVTAPAWVSFATGKNPGQHGIFDFRQFNRLNNRIQFNNSSSVHAATIWQLMNQAGKKSITLNVPLTYPISPVNGIMISGMMSPGATGKIEERICFPKNIAQELNQRFPDYRLFVSQDLYYEKGLETFLLEVKKVTQARGELALFLMQHYDWDFFMVHFQNLDSVQHALWPILMNIIQNPEKFIEHPLFDFLKTLDRIIGQIKEKLEPTTALIILSDHGFGPLNKLFNLNAWLHQESLLAVNRFGKFYKWFLNQLYKPIRLGYRLKLEQWNITNLILSRFHQKLNQVIQQIDIDWNKTKVYILPGPFIYGLLYFNISREDEKFQILKGELIQKLEKMIDEETGERIVEQIFDVDKIYDVLKPEISPNLIIQFKPGYICFSNPISKKSENKLILPTQRDHGTHQVEGMIIFHGEEFKKNTRIENAGIIDLLPTILAILQIPIPAALDGKILNEIFLLPENLKSVQSSKEATEQSTNENFQYSAQEHDEVANRLKELGYL
ncbi:alkaline phosphatase family protein [candidate division KSB1 bacterium]|nr:alkaline phosphatase family protein [candidate division KSB1 bacterium]